MRKSIRNLLWGAGATALVAAGVGVFFLRGTGVDPRKVLDSLAKGTPPGRIMIEYPLEGTLFPPEISVPAFR